MHHACRAAEQSETIQSPVHPCPSLSRCEHLLDLTLNRALCVQHHKQICCLYGQVIALKLTQWCTRWTASIVICPDKYAGGRANRCLANSWPNREVFSCY